MANKSIYDAFERMWQHIIAVAGGKSDRIHDHDDIYYEKTEVDNLLNNIDISSKADLIDGKVPSAQLPSYVDDIIEGTYVSSTEFKDTESNIITAESGKIYVDITTNKSYRWSGSQYIELTSSTLILGDTPETAYRGDLGKIAYKHSQASGNPHETTAADIGAATQEDIPTKISQLENDSGFSDGDMKKAIYDKNNDGIVDNAEKVNGFTVGCNVPNNAIFTDGQVSQTKTSSSNNQYPLLLSYTPNLATDKTEAVRFIPDVTLNPSTSTITANITGRAGHADYADSAYTANDAEYADNAGHADSADTANNAGYADNAGHANTADVANEANSASYANSAYTANSASYADSANEASSAEYANNARYADTARYANSAGATIGALTINVNGTTKTFNGSSDQSVEINASSLGLGVSGAMHFRGIVTSLPNSGNTNGDVVLYGNKEYVWNTDTWVELGDEGSHALKTITISAGSGLTGGGTLEANRTISHGDTSTQASIAADGRRYITGVTLDDYGHVTGLTTNTETVTNTTYTIATGDSNGQIKVTPSSGTAYNVLVKGLGSAAYTASTAYAPASHTQAASTITGLATVATSGNYNDLSNKPTSLPASDVSAWAKAATKPTYTAAEVGALPSTTTIPTVYNGTLTIKKNGTSVGTFTANQSTSSDINIIVPTKVSELTNDSGFKTTDNNTTYTFATGSTNGTFTVTPLGGTAQSVAIKGLGSLAYSSATIPTVNNGTLTIQRNGANVTTFSANQSGNATANIIDNDTLNTTGSSNNTGKLFLVGAGSQNAAGVVTYSNSGVYMQNGSLTASTVYGAVWNDYAEYRQSDITEAGRVICENGDDTLSLSTERLQPGASIVSDTFGFAIGETDECKTPVAVSGRVLVYPYEDRESYKPGDAVCAAPNGTVSKMTREEIREYPERIIGTVSAIPSYETWGTGNVKVNGRIWVKVK